MIASSIRWLWRGTVARPSEAGASRGKVADVARAAPREANDTPADIDRARAFVGAPTAHLPSGANSSGNGPLAVRLAQVSPTEKPASPKFTTPIHVGDRVLHQRSSRSFEVARVIDVDEARGVYYVERKPIYESDAVVLHVERAALRAIVPDDASPYRKGDVVMWTRGPAVASTVDVVFEGGGILCEGVTFAHDASELTSFSTTMKTAAGSDVKAGEVVSYARGLARFHGVTADGVVHAVRLSENDILPEVRLVSAMDATFAQRELGAVVHGLEGTPYATGTQIDGGVVRAVYDNGTIALDNVNRAVAGPPRVETTVRADADVSAFLARHARRRAAEGTEGQRPPGG